MFISVPWTCFFLSYCVFNILHKLKLLQYLLFYFGFLYCYKEVNFISKSLSQPGLLKDDYSVPWTCFALERVVVPWTLFLPLSCLDVGSLGCIYQFITFWSQENDENPVASSKMI